MTDFPTKLATIQARYNQLAELMNTEQDSTLRTKHAKEYATLAPLQEPITQLQKTAKELEEVEPLLQDKEMAAIASEEQKRLQAQHQQLELQIKRQLLRGDAMGDRDVILEIRAGAGGSEAALFTADLMRMYQRYAEYKKWQWEIMAQSETEIGGLKEVIIQIKGTRPFASLANESGTHRVQRIPTTEAGGRIHTSTATVAVLPQAEEVDVTINPSDLRIDVFRASGPGGQSVNTTDSAVRITHLPTGTTVQCQDEKSQHRNKAKAMTVLRARIYRLQQQAEEQKRAAQRRSQIGSGDRSERIRTYNFPQGRVTDHRIGVTLYKLKEMLEGGEPLEELIQSLTKAQEAEQLANL